MKYKFFLNLLLLSTFSFSCVNRNISRYFFKNKTVLDDLQKDYAAEYSKRPFSLEYSDKSFNNISIEIITDSIKYIYGFNIKQTVLNDTLNKYKIRPEAIDHLLKDMKSINCIWLNKLDYYVDGKKNLLVFMSIREKRFHFPLAKRRYYILSYFEQHQYFDKNGKLLNKRRQKAVRKIHGDVFKRITDKVAYTVSDRFR